MSSADAKLCQEAQQALARLNAIDAERVGDPNFSTTQFDKYPASNRYVNVYPCTFAN
mgnify:FL=1